MYKSRSVDVIAGALLLVKTISTVRSWDLKGGNVGNVCHEPKLNSLIIVIHQTRNAVKH